MESETRNSDSTTEDGMAALARHNFERAEHWQHQFHVMGETAHKAEVDRDRYRELLRFLVRQVAEVERASVIRESRIYAEAQRVVGSS